MRNRIHIKIFMGVILSSLYFSCSYNKKELPEPVELPESGQMITYSSYGKEVFEDNCVSCHSAAGSGILPFLTTYQEIKSQADAGRIQARLIDGSPSFMPISGSLPQNVKDTIQFWLNQGALE